MDEFEKALEEKNSKYVTIDKLTFRDGARWAREFWIDASSVGHCQMGGSCFVSEEDDKMREHYEEEVHVIEHSAYEKLRTENAKLRGALETTTEWCEQSGFSADDLMFAFEALKETGGGDGKR